MGAEEEDFQDIFRAILSMRASWVRSLRSNTYYTPYDRAILVHDALLLSHLLFWSWVRGHSKSIFFYFKIIHIQAKFGKLLKSNCRLGKVKRQNPQRRILAWNVWCVMSWVTDLGACQTENGKPIFRRIPSGPRHTECYSSWQQLNRNPCSPYMDGGRNANSRSITRFDSTMSLNDKRVKVSHIVISRYSVEWKKN